MKNLITLLSIAISLTSNAQISGEVGMSSRISGTAKIAYEVPIKMFNIEVGTMASIDNYRPIVSLQTGVTMYVDRYNQELRLAIGPYYHSGILLPDKDVREKKILFGGSARFKWDCNVFVTGEWNGEYGKIGIGYLFGKK